MDRFALKSAGDKDLMQVLAWYDNEMDYAAQMVRAPAQVG